jgi:serine/threonine protein kinase/Tol biopolymer transport system component
MAIAPGTTLGRYEIQTQLGAGGMGEVYLARDTKLERTVALKILPEDVASNKERMRRFVQEAKAAAILSHPNIAHIYEIEETDGLHFIAMEFVDGDTLRSKIYLEQPGLKKLLDYLTQVADGLAKAHAAGIVHRDLKPDNIMVTRDGYAKILDFGLAKLIEPARPIVRNDAREASTVAMEQHTQSGVVMGTVGYMSPEQARGVPVDQRSDIFSFGCILYEAATSHKAFEGDSVIDSLHKIIYSPVPAISDFNPTAPAELQRIVRRCLAKDAEERYQTIKDVAIELKELRRDMESGSPLSQQERTLSASATSGSSRRSEASARSGAPTLVEADNTETTARTEQVKAGRTTSSVEYIATEVKRHKVGFGVAAGILALVVAGLGYGIYRIATHKESFPQMKITRLTTNGKATNASIARDGKYVVYAIDDMGQQSLWVKHIATGSNVQIVAPAKVRYAGMTFSPDGNYVYYVALKEGEEAGILYQAPVLGSDERKLLANVQSAITFSPDGRRFAFVRTLTPGEKAVVVVNADGTGERILATRKLPNLLTAAPAWSPDGKTVAYASAVLEGSSRPTIVFTIPVEGGAEKPVSSRRWQYVPYIAWLGDSSGLVINGREKQSDLIQIWQLSPDGEARIITNDLSWYESLSVTGDSESLVTVRNERNLNIWIAPVGEASQPKQITSGGKGEGMSGLAWTPDGRIVYSSNHSIWIMGADGAGQKQLTIDPSAANYWPAVSPDNRYIVFSSFRAGYPYIWRMDLDGGNLKQLTEGYGNDPQFSPDGRWVVYEYERSGKPTLWKVSIDGGAPVQLTDKPSQDPTVSPDGKLIACNYWAEANAPSKVALIPFAGGQPVKILDLPTYNFSDVHWTPDGRALSYIGSAGGSNIWTQPLDGGKPVQVTDFKTDRILNFAWSKVGKQLALSRGSVTSDVVLIDGFR